MTSGRGTGSAPRAIPPRLEPPGAAPTPQAVPPRLEPPGAAKGVGVIAPFDFMLDRELWELVPASVTLYVTRTPYVDLAVSAELAEELSDEGAIGAAARDLSIAWPAATVYLCTSASFVDGLAGEERLRTIMEAHGAMRAVTTSGALLEALAALDVRRVGVATPYDAELTGRLATFLDEAAFEPVASACLGLTGNIPQVSPDTVRELARVVAVADAEAVFLSCTNLPTAGVLPELEHELGLPVLSANLVSLWSALRTLDELPADRPELLFRRTAGP